MTSPSPLITGTDFITVATRDFDAAIGFYGDVLGLPESKRWGQLPAAEFETGNLTIAVMQSDAFGLEFHSSFASTTSRRPAPSSSHAGWSSRARRSTPACAGRPSSTIPTATRSRSTIGTRRAEARAKERWALRHLADVQHALPNLGAVEQRSRSGALGIRQVCVEIPGLGELDEVHLSSPVGGAHADPALAAMAFEKG
jgi:catechol 2,3-dioxygenase-like lactoylglutathione lyase family enzyme